MALQWLPALGRRRGPFGPAGWLPALAGRGRQARPLAGGRPAGPLAPPGAGPLVIRFGLCHAMVVVIAATIAWDHGPGAYRAAAGRRVMMTGRAGRRRACPGRPAGGGQGPSRTRPAAATPAPLPDGQQLPDRRPWRRSRRLAFPQLRPLVGPGPVVPGSVYATPRPG